jgi:3-methyladenine DNA glycosylase AlkD
MSSSSNEILAYLAKNGNEKAKQGMSRFGIQTEKAFGISIPVLRELARKHKKDHALALELWASGYHEARILASMVDDPKLCTEAQMEAWVVEFNSWDLCDQTCFGLFARSAFGMKKVFEWGHREEEYVRRAGFALMAAYALSAHKTKDEELLAFMPLIEQYSTDNRNFVRKAVNWALRQIGKRNWSLHKPAVAMAEKLMNSGDKTARWIGKDAYRELTGEGVKKTLERRNKKNS